MDGNWLAFLIILLMGLSYLGGLVVGLRCGPPTIPTDPKPRRLEPHQASPPGPELFVPRTHEADPHLPGTGPVQLMLVDKPHLGDALTFGWKVHPTAMAKAWFVPVWREVEYQRRRAAG